MSKTCGEGLVRIDGITNHIEMDNAALIEAAKRAEQKLIHLSGPYRDISVEDLRDVLSDFFKDIIKGF